MKKSRREGPLGLQRGDIRDLIPVTEEERKQNFTWWINALQDYCKCCNSSETSFEDKNWLLTASACVCHRNMPMFQEEAKVFYSSVGSVKKYYAFTTKYII